MDLLRAITHPSAPENSKELITIVGAGGKTSTLFILAKELKGLGKRVLVTTTTGIYEPGPRDYDRLCIGEKNKKIEKRGKSPGDGKSGEIVVWASKTCKEGKLRGLAPQEIDRIWGTREFSWILVEGDGARGKSMKAPKEDEPVIPLATTLVIGVMGMEVLGKPLRESLVHRLKHFSKVTGAKEGDRIEEETLGRLVLHEEGLFKGSPRGAKTLLLLNQCEDIQIRKRALAFGKTLGIPYVVTSLQRGEIYGGLKITD